MNDLVLRWRPAFATTFIAAVGIAFGIAARASGQSLPTPVTIITSFPPPAADAFVTNMRFGPDGLIYAWDGQNVWRQSGVNVDSFGVAPFGTVPSVGSDAGPINFSQDGQTILIGNGAGGNDFSGASSGLVYTMPATGGVATPAGTLPFHQDFVPAPAAATMRSSATKFLVDRGTADFSSSGVDLFDFKSDKTLPVIANIPGASASITFDSANRLYVGIGFGANRGQIRRFTLPLVDLAAAGTPLDWTTGQLINSADNNGGSGMFLDGRGNLFVGGPNGVTVFDPTGGAQVYSTGPSTFPVVFHNATNDQFSLTLNGFSDPMNLGFSPRIYRAADFTVPVPAAIVWTADTGGNWSDGSRWSQPAAPSGIDQRATLGPNITASRTIALDVPVTLGVLSINSPQKYLVSGSNPLTMQVSSTIAAINVSGGSHEIAAPIVMANDTDVTVSNSADSLTMSGGISGSGMLSKEGAGTLAITAANSYAGNTAIDAGRLRFEIISGTPSIAAGTVVTITAGATLELAGSVSALGSAGGNRAHIINDSASSGLIISGTSQVVGAINGGGITTVGAGGDLTADRIVQNALIIEGTATSHATLTIAATNSAPPTLIAGSTPSQSPADNPDPVDQAALLSGPSLTGGIAGSVLKASMPTDSVPEPTSIALEIIGALSIAATLTRRRLQRR